MPKSSSWGTASAAHQVEGNNTNSDWWQFEQRPGAIWHNDRSGKHALFIPVVHSDGCTGCGKCEKSCILEEAAIKVFPIALAKGMLGRHYRLGWEQQSQAGGPLVTPDVPHRYNLPEGLRYDHGGEGLIRDEPIAPPFSENPLDTLNRKGGL